MEEAGRDAQKYSGHETVGMRRVNCTLKLRPHWVYATEIVTLAPKRVVVPRDGQRHSTVQFRGCKIIQLGVRSEEETVMPTKLTIGGPCTYEKKDKKDFEIMMRTKEQSRVMHLPPNGEFDWPDYRAFEMCPICSKRAKPGSGDRYWLLFQPLLQHFESEHQRGMGIRFVNRLTCEECFETMTQDQSVEAKVSGMADFVDVPLLDVVEGQGPITWMRDGQMSVRSQGGQCLSAYELYGAWENSGAWQALSDHFTDFFQQVSQGTGFGGFEVRNKMKGIREREDPSLFWEMDQIPTKEGKECDGPDCARVHGTRSDPKPGEKRGKKIRLHECTGCFEALYCSEYCQQKAWPGGVQRKISQHEEMDWLLPAEAVERFVGVELLKPAASTTQEKAAMEEEHCCEGGRRPNGIDSVLADMNAKQEKAERRMAERRRLERASRPSMLSTKYKKRRKTLLEEELMSDENTNPNVSNRAIEKEGLAAAKTSNRVSIEAGDVEIPPKAAAAAVAENADDVIDDSESEDAMSTDDTSNDSDYEESTPNRTAATFKSAAVPKRSSTRIVCDKQARTQDDIGRGGLAPTEAKGGRSLLDEDHANDTSEAVLEGKRKIPKGAIAMLQIDKDATAGGVVTQDEYAVVRCICDYLSNCTATDFKMPVLVSDEGPHTLPRGLDFRHDTSPAIVNYLEMAKNTWLKSFVNLKGEGCQSDAGEISQLIFGASSHTGIGVSVYNRDLDKLSVICDDNTLSEEPIILHKYKDGDRECINLQWHPDERYFDFTLYFWSRDINPSGWEPSLERRAGVRTLLEEIHFLETDHMSGMPGFVPKHILTANPALDLTVGALPPTFVDMPLRPKFNVLHSSSSELLQVKEEASSKLDGTRRGGYLRVYLKAWPEVQRDICTALRDSNLDASVRRFMEKTLEQYEDDAPQILSLLYGGMSHIQSVDERLDPKGRKGFEQKFLTAVGGPTMETIIFNSQSKRQSDMLEAFACGLLECGTRRNTPSFVFLSRGLGGLNVVGGGLPVWQRFNNCGMKAIVRFMIENSAELADELVASSHQIVMPVRMYLYTVQLSCLAYLRTREEYRHMATVEQVTLCALHSYTSHLSYEAKVTRIAREFGIEDRADAKRLLHQKLREIQVWSHMAENNISSFDEASSHMQRERSLSAVYDMDELELLKEDIVLSLANAEGDSIQSKVEALVGYHKELSMDEVTVSLGCSTRIEFRQASADVKRCLSQTWASDCSAVISSPDAVWRIEHEMRALLDVLGDDELFKSKPAPFIRRVLQFILNRGRGQAIQDVVEDYAGNIGNDLEARLVQALEDAGERIDASLNERRKDSVKIETLKDVLRSVRSPLEFADVVTISDAVYQNAAEDARITLASSFGGNVGMCIAVTPSIAKDQVMLEAQSVLRVFERDDCFVGRTIAFVRDALKMILNVKSAVREAVLEENAISRAELALTAEQAKIAHDTLLKRYKDDGLSSISIYKYKDANNRIIIQKMCLHFGTKFNLMLEGNSVVEAATGADFLTRVHALCADKTKKQQRQLLKQLDRSPPAWVNLTETSIPADVINAAKTKATKKPFNYPNPSEIAAKRAAEINERGLDLQRELTTEKKVEIFRAVIAKIGVIL